MPRGKRNRKRNKNRRRAWRRGGARSEAPAPQALSVVSLQRILEKKESKTSWVDLGGDRKEKPASLIPLAGLRGLFKRYETRICLGGQVHTNVGVSYLAQWDIAGVSSNNNTLAWAQVANAAEFSSLDALFDEFFIRSARLRYFPVNKYSAQGAASYVVATAAGSPGTMNTCAATIVFLPHASPIYISGSTAFVAMRSAEQSLTLNVGENRSLPAVNTEKFAWDGPLGDQASTGTTMSWCGIANTAKYGGTFQMATAHSSGASVSAGLFPEGGLFGDWILEFVIAFRARA